MDNLLKDHRCPTFSPSVFEKVGFFPRAFFVALQLYDLGRTHQIAPFPNRER